MVSGLSLYTGLAQAQEKVAAVVPQPSSSWTHKLVGAVNVTQVALKDWAQGGEDALAWTLSLDGGSDYTQGKIDWQNSYKFAFGQTKLGDQGIRKTDDKIDLQSTLTYKMGTYVNPFIGATLKSQFAKGYAYGDAGKTPLSQLFDPAYMTQSAGIGYQPITEAKTRLGLALREIITRDFNGFSDDLATLKIEKSKIDGGLESITEAEWEVVENILLSSKLELFAPFSDLDQTSLRNDSTVSMKVNKYVTVNFNVQIVDDETASAKTQLKEALSVGLSYSFI
jgi:hypothetical protein